MRNKINHIYDSSISQRSISKTGSSQTDVIELKQRQSSIPSKE